MLDIRPNTDLIGLLFMFERDFCWRASKNLTTNYHGIGDPYRGWRKVMRSKQ